MRNTFIVIFGLTLALATGCDRLAPGETPHVATEATASTVPQGIRTVKAEELQVPDSLEVPARMQAEPTRVVHVYPPVGGRVVSVSVNPGEHVGKGQTLAILESNDVTSARADFQKARTDLELKENSRQRASLLFENQVLAEKDYRQAVADAEMAQAEVERTRDRLRILGIDPAGASNRFALRAPLAGVVLDLGASPGEMSKSLDAPAPLCTLADLSTIWAVGEIFEKDLAGLRPGNAAEVTLNAYPGEVWKGSVAAISDVVDPGTRTLKVRVVLANPRWRLKPEMFGTIRLYRAARSAVVVPATAVLHDDSRTFVMVERSAGQYERRPVTLGRTLEQGLELTSGVKPGEVLVAEGALLLRTTNPQDER